MNEMLDRLDDAARRQQQFVADASHELRSPLARIRSEVEVDLARPERAEPFDTLRSVLEEVDELAALVDDLMALARADAGATTVHPVPVDLDDIVLGLVRRVGADNHVTIDATGVSAAQVAGEERQLSHAVGNLIDNAVRHAATTVRVALTEHGSEAMLSVTDDGPGIPADQRQRVFERFARLDDARTRDTGGSGLGLAIARDVVTRHGGTILVDPEYADGARFIVRLPLLS
jgi:signal transduction histidine kinase